MSNDVTVDIPIEDIRAEIDSALETVAAQVYEKAKATTAFRDKTGKLRRSIWIYRSKYENGGYVVYVKAPHSHLVEFGHAVVTKDGKVLEHRVAGKFFLRKARNAVRRTVDETLRGMLGDAHFGKLR